MTSPTLLTFCYSKRLARSIALDIGPRLIFLFLDVSQRITLESIYPVFYSTNNKIMIKYIYPLEKILFVLLLVINFTGLNLPLWVLALIIFAGSLFLQGAKPYTPLLIISLILAVIEQILLQRILLAVVGVLMAWMRFYSIEIYDKGQFQVGYRQHSVDNIQTAVFYPTLSEGKPTSWMTSEEYYRSLYDMVFIHPCSKQIFPFSVFKFILSFLQKIEMPVRVGSHISTDDSQLALRKKVILFSHGLGSCMTNYSSLCGWWASHGYIVISVNHTNDQIRLTCSKEMFEMTKELQRLFFQYRNRDLVVRAQQLEFVVDRLLQGKLLKEVFAEVPRNIEVQEVYLAGHSYGGATALETMANLRMKQKVSPLIKGLVCLDPWFFPLSSTTYEHLNNENLLFLHSQTFFRAVPYICYLQEKLNRLKQTNEETLKAFVAKKIDHLNITDFSLTLGSITKHAGLISLQHHTPSVFAFHQKAISLFMKGKSKEKILEKINIYAKETGLYEAGVCLEEEWRFQTDPSFVNF